MPSAYLTLGAKLRFSVAALLSMMAGAQLVHAIYRPLDDMDELVKAEMDRIRESSAKAAS